MDSTANQLRQLLDLDARHDDLLRRLDELDKRVAKTLAEYQPLGKGIEVTPQSDALAGEPS